MWYMLLEPKLRIYPNLLSRHSAPGFLNLRKGSAPRWTNGSFVARAWEKFNDGRLRRRAIKEFYDLDDRLLRDIGLDRDRIPETVDAMLRHRPVPTDHVARIGRESEKAGASFLARIGARFVMTWVRRRAINELMRLDRRLLHDIGLHRDQIPHAVDAMLGRRPAPSAGATVHRLFIENEAARSGFPTRAAA